MQLSHDCNLVLFAQLAEAWLVPSSPLNLLLKLRVQLGPRALLNIGLQMARWQVAPSLQLNPLLQPVQVCLAPRQRPDPDLQLA